MSDWLLKTEPDAYSLDDLERDGTTPWDGIRNYQARNFMRDDMKPGDRVLIYHSRVKPPAVVGTAEVASEIKPDPLQFDETSKYFDPKSKPEAPRWLCRDIRFVSRLTRPVPLDELKSDAQLEGILVAKRGNRLSITPVEPEHFDRIIDLASRTDS